MMTAFAIVKLYTNQYENTEGGGYPNRKLKNRFTIGHNISNRFKIFSQIKQKSKDILGREWNNQRNRIWREYGICREL